MRRAQLLVYEADGRLADLLRDGAARHGWWLRELRHEASLRDILRPGEGTVLVLKVGRDLEAEMGLLEEVGWDFPAVDVVLVGDVENSALANLAWDLGARFVLFPPLPRALLPEIVAGLLGAPGPRDTPR
jgi:hypothetical protein